MNILATCLKRLACLYMVTFGHTYVLQGSSLLAVNSGGGWPEASLPCCTHLEGLPATAKPGKASYFHDPVKKT